MRLYKLLPLLVVVPLCLGNSGCPTNAPVSSSGVRKAEAKVRVGADGLTVEQKNVKRRIEEDNKPGSMKFLYVFSNYTGRVMFTSIVDGKVTSSGKRLTPKMINHMNNTGCGPFNDMTDGQCLEVNGRTAITNELIEDDGTYGDSSPYVYWFDPKGIYHQLYITGGQTMVVRSQPIALPKDTLTIELE